MRLARSPFLMLALALAGAALVASQPGVAQAPESSGAARTRPFEISTGNLFEALRQMAAYRDLDLVIDPEVPNDPGLCAFSHVTWEKALDMLAASHGLGWEVRDGILRIGRVPRLANDLQRPAAPNARTLSITYRSTAEGDPLLSVEASRVTRPELLEALARIERIAKAQAGPQSFRARWALRPMRETARSPFETFSLEDITLGGLRALCR